MAHHPLCMLKATGLAVLLSMAPAGAQSTTATMPARPTAAVRVPPTSPPPGMLQANPVSRRAMSPEDRITLLEDALQKAEHRIAVLEARLSAHTHTYQYMVVGLLREPLNGRPVELAISPHSLTGTTSPPR